MAGSMLTSGSYYGVTTKRIDAGSLTFIQTRYAPRQRVEPHWHERPYFCYAVSGAFDEQSGGRSQRCGPGSLIFHPAGETHTDRFDESGGVCLNLELRADLLVTGPSEPAAGAVGRDGHVAGGAPRRLARDMSREFQAAVPSALVLEGLGLALIGEACRTVPRDARQPPQWLPRAVELLHDRFREPIGLSSVAAELGVHAVHLARIFRKHTGVTVGEQIRALRIDFASRELTAGRKTIAEIAHTSGFADQAHFSRCFRAHVGVSPARFRALRRDH